ncbi:hypothetical protein BOX15_Mlig009841g1 [Macrostomum lignano]|uniref:Uncharacterized protein n=2 Tax=Macrostomum lignano TaxID=282301 RepID=A0A267EZB9_9PLAT|nr:hypothetical protein BOX15_Mlig009841g1 [Macrostomum lignano]
MLGQQHKSGTGCVIMIASLLIMSFISATCLALPQQSRDGASNVVDFENEGDFSDAASSVPTDDQFERRRELMQKIRSFLLHHRGQSPSNQELRKRHSGTMSMKKIRTMFDMLRTG